MHGIWSQSQLEQFFNRSSSDSVGHLDLVIGKVTFLVIQDGLNFTNEMKFAMGLQEEVTIDSPVLRRMKRQQLQRRKQRNGRVKSKPRRDPSAEAKLVEGATKPALLPYHTQHMALMDSS